MPTERGLLKIVAEANDGRRFTFPFRNITLPSQQELVRYREYVHKELNNFPNKAKQPTGWIIVKEGWTQGR